MQCNGIVVKWERDQLDECGCGRNFFEDHELKCKSHVHSWFVHAKISVM